MVVVARDSHKMKKSENEDREARVGTHLGEREGVKRKVVNVYRCRTMGK
jgi:hypothetical protein